MSACPTIELEREVLKMRTLRTVYIVVLAASAILASSATRAQEAPSADAAYAEMKEMFGGVPSILQVYPKSAVPAGWALVKETDLNQNTALPAKTRELIALGVAAQIPCQYCIYYHTKAAKAAGATEEEIREAVHMSSLVRHWSTVLQGNQYDLEDFKAETDAAFKTE
jgi:AhpD family alkylhydroperoxidase